MRETWKRIWQATLILLVTAVVGVADTSNNNPPPGTLNYVEGQVSVQGQKQTPKSVGTTYLEPNQVLDTGNGNAEILLTPGIFMRIGHNSEVKMISPGLADTQVQLTRGSAMVEVDELFKENDVSVVVDGATTQMEKLGLYDFTANPSSVKVLEGKAVTFEGDQQVKLTKGHEALLAEAQPLARQSYNKDQIEEDPLYRWSKLRSDYATESNVDAGNDLYDGRRMVGAWLVLGPVLVGLCFHAGIRNGVGCLRLSILLTVDGGLCALLWFWLRGRVWRLLPLSGHRSPQPWELAAARTSAHAGIRRIPRSAANHGEQSHGISGGRIPRRFHGRLSWWWHDGRVPRWWLWGPTLIQRFNPPAPCAAAVGDGPVGPRRVKHGQQSRHPHAFSSRSHG